MRRITTRATWAVALPPSWSDDVMPWIYFRPPLNWNYPLLSLAQDDTNASATATPANLTDQDNIASRSSDNDVEEDLYVNRVEFAPTFSINIVRTPDHYKASLIKARNNGRDFQSFNRDPRIVEESSGKFHDANQFPPTVTLRNNDSPGSARTPNGRSATPRTSQMESRQMTVLTMLPASPSSIRTSTLSDILYLVEEPATNLFSPLRLMSPESICLFDCHSS